MTQSNVGPSENPAVRSPADTIAVALVPDAKVRRSCHNEESPFYKAFEFKSFFAKIAHPKSGKAAQ